MTQTKVVALREGTYNGDLEIVPNDLPQDYSKIKIFFQMK